MNNAIKSNLLIFFSKAIHIFSLSTLQIFFIYMYFHFLEGGYNFEIEKNLGKDEQLFDGFFNKHSKVISMRSRSLTMLFKRENSTTIVVLQCTMGS